LLKNKRATRAGRTAAVVSEMHIAVWLRVRHRSFAALNDASL